MRRVEYELRSKGVKLTEGNSLRSGVHSRGYLPHVKREGASYFVTFRLADALPREVLQQFQMEKAERLKANRHSDEKAALELSRKIQRYLDRGAGSCCLANPIIADLAANTLHHFHGERYLLRDWVVMPNHVHAVVWPMPNHKLSDILKSWKQFIARRAMEMPGCGGQSFWQPESYDHWIRDDAEASRISCYIRNNPVTARLCAQSEDWKWSSAWRGRMQEPRAD